MLALHLHCPSLLQAVPLDPWVSQTHAEYIKLVNRKIQASNDVPVQLGWSLNPSWHLSHCLPWIFGLQEQFPSVLLQIKLVDPLGSHAQTTEKFWNIEGYSKEFYLQFSVWLQNGKPKWKSVHSVHFSPWMSHLQWHCPDASHPLVSVPLGWQLQSSTIKSSSQ